MKITRAAAAVALSAAVAAPMSLAPSAQAATRTITDRAGDAGGAKRLDIVSVRVNNADRRIVARVGFAKHTAGSVIVSLDPRGAKGVRLVAVRKKDGTLKSYLVPGAFTDRGNIGSGQTCPGADVKVRWRAKAVRMVMPSKCLHHGNYGAIRFAVLTENGADSDYAPETRRGDLGSSRWLSRG